MQYEEFLKMKELKDVKSKIPEFIKNNPLFQCLDESQTKQLEAELYQLIYSVKEPIYRAVEREYLRQDVIDKVNEFYERKGKIVVKALPLDQVDDIVNDWQNDLSDADSYWEENWELLFKVLERAVWLSEIEQYSESNVCLYGVYLKDWYASHDEGYPVCIKEFFNCEMQDEKLHEYYMNLLTEDSKEKPDHA